MPLPQYLCNRDSKSAPSEGGWDARSAQEKVHATQPGAQHSQAPEQGTGVSGSCCIFIVFMPFLSVFIFFEVIDHSIENHLAGQATHSHPPHPNPAFHSAGCVS